MIKFFCRGCGKELWEGYVKSIMEGKKMGDTIDELWNKLLCTDCWLQKISNDFLNTPSSNTGGKSHPG